MLAHEGVCLAVTTGLLCVELPPDAGPHLPFQVALGDAGGDVLAGGEGVDGLWSGRRRRASRGRTSVRRATWAKGGPGRTRSGGGRADRCRGRAGRRWRLRRRRGLRRPPDHLHGGWTPALAVSHPRASPERGRTPASVPPRARGGPPEPSRG